MDVLDAVNEIINKNPNINLLTFTKYPKQILIQNRIKLNVIDEKFISAAQSIRNNFSLPFWDSLMLSFFDKENVSIELLSSALLHNKNTDKIRTRKIEDIRIFLDNNPKDNLSLNSEIFLNDNSIKHLLLLDFHIFPSTNNFKIVYDILCILNVHGYILDSGESYHFVSNSFYELDSLLDLLAKALLFSPIIDRAWIAHQILERSCSLRVGEKHNITPTVINKV
ncbi:hypothetical protein DESC_820038 [Desulfosarcina cetonica]|uniref:primase 1D-like protein n=1 Tax=Desulfosarcina cetonica TaxID=90730 RepID=UPI0006D01152|nr:hypothetical protein [Desulfosarcina cetonica]VTR70678.1 hypothetical protein DESC_820038 [Desulfosarcina cetonica]